MVMDAADGVAVALSHRTDDVAHALLHFGVGTLHGVQLDGVAVLARIDTRHGAATHTDAVVVATQHDDDVALFGFQLLGILHLGEADAAGQHDDLVVAKGFLFAMFESQQTTVDKGLAELIAEVGGAVGGLDEDLLRGLIEPLARLDVLLPLTALLCAGIGGHIDGSTRQRQAALTTGQTVADLAARTRGSAVERLHGGREVMRLGFQRKHRLEGFDLEGRRLVGLGGSKLLHLGAEDEGHIVLVGRHQSVRVHLRGLLDEGEERVGHLLAIDDESAVEDLVAAVLGVDLCEAIHLAVGKFAPNLCRYAFQVFHLLTAQGQTFLLVVGLNVVDVFQRLGLAVHREHLLVEVLIAVLQHRVVRSLLRVHFLELLDTDNTFDTHVLGDLDGIGAPRRDHLTARAYKMAFHRVFFDHCGVTEKPRKLGNGFL